MVEQTPNSTRRFDRLFNLVSGFWSCVTSIPTAIQSTITWLKETFDVLLDLVERLVAIAAAGLAGVAVYYLAYSDDPPVKSRQDSVIHPRQLDRCGGTGTAPVLRDGQSNAPSLVDQDGGNRGGNGEQADKRNRPRHSRRGKLMPSTMLMADNFLRIPVHVRYQRGGVFRFRYRIVAEEPVSAYVVDQANLQLFEAGSQFTHYSPNTPPQYEHHRWVTVTQPGRWWIVIENTSQRDIAVFYETDD